MHELIFVFQNTKTVVGRIYFCFKFLLVAKNCIQKCGVLTVYGDDKWFNCSVTDSMPMVVNVAVIRSTNVAMSCMYQTYDNNSKVTKKLFILLQKE